MPPKQVKLTPARVSRPKKKSEPKFPRTNFTDEDKLKAWNNADEIPGKDPKQYRLDPYKNEMKWDDYGKPDKRKGWELDHIEPVSRGGKNTTFNIQCLNIIVNRSKGNSLVKKSRHSKG